MRMKEAVYADEKKVRIGAKPKISSILSLTFAMMMLGSGSPGLMVLGAVFGGISLIVIFAVRDEIKAEIFAGRLLFYHKAGEVFCDIALDEIVEWNTLNKGIEIQTRDQQRYFVDTYDTIKAHHELKKVLPHQETAALLQQKRRQRKG